MPEQEFMIYESFRTGGFVAGLTVAGSKQKVEADRVCNFVCSDLLRFTQIWSDAPARVVTSRGYQQPQCGNVDVIEMDMSKSGPLPSSREKANGH